MLNSIPERFYCYFSSNCEGFNKYILENVNKNDVKTEHINKIVHLSFESNDISTLKFIESNFAYRPSLEDINTALSNYYCTTELIDYFFEKENNMKIGEQILDQIVANRNINVITHIYENYKNKIDLDQIFTLKKINTYTLLGYGNYEFYTFIYEKINKSITPYTIEIFLKNSYYYTISQTIYYLLDQKGVITQSIINLLKLKLKIKKGKKIFEKYEKIDQYVPNPEEIPDNINIIAIDELEFMIDGEHNKIDEIDEIDQAIKEAEMKLLDNENN